MNENINSRITNAAFWMVGVRQMDRLIGLVSIAVLARLLLPDDFGVVVYATTLVAMIEMFFQFGLETVLIRDQDAGRAKYNTAWTLKVITGVVLCLMLIGSAGLAAEYFSDPRVEDVVYWIAFAPLIRSLENIGIVDFQKELEFSKEFLLRFSVRVIGTSATIIFAYVLRDYWAIVYGMLITNFASLLLSYVMSPYRPWFDMSEISRVFGFSKWMVVMGILDSVLSRLPIFFLGRYFDAAVVAFYNMGNELANMATGEIAAPIRRALFPGVMKIVDDEKLVVDTIVNTLGLIAIIGLPVSIGIGLTAPLFTPLFLGENWTGVIPILQILAINGAVTALYSNSHVIYYAINKPEITALVTGARVVLVSAGLLWVLPEYGVVGAAWVWTAANALVTLGEYVLFYRLVTVSVWTIVDRVWRSITAVLAMALAVHLTMSTFALHYPSGLPVVQLVVAIGAGGISYVGCATLLWFAVGKPRGAERFILDFVLAKLGRA